MSAADQIKYILRCPTLYDVLNVKRDATTEQIRKNYLFFSKRIHPDRNKDVDGATEAFQKINEAKSRLSDPRQRAAYDAELNDNVFPRFPKKKRQSSQTQPSSSSNQKQRRRRQEQDAFDREWMEFISRKLAEEMIRAEKERKSQDRWFAANVLIGTLIAIFLLLKFNEYTNKKEDVAIPVPQITEITNQTQLFRGCLSKDKVACVILFLPPLSICSSGCRFAHIVELEIASVTTKHQIGWFWSEVGRQEKLEAALGLGGIQSNKTVLSVVKFHKGLYWKLEEDLKPSFQEKRGFVQSVINKSSKAKGHNVKGVQRGELPEIAIVPKSPDPYEESEDTESTWTELILSWLDYLVLFLFVIAFIKTTFAQESTLTMETAIFDLKAKHLFMHLYTFLD